MDSVLIVAAEASSSLYAQRLLELWKTQGRQVQAFGVGSRDMEKLGFECLGRSEEMAVVGLQEVIKHFPLIRRVYKSLLSETEKRKPKFALLLDYPDFNLRLAKDLKKRGVKVIYYISPQVWAWRTGRVKTIKKVVDHMLVLFPFEETFYKENDMRVDFVGHPLLDELPEVPVETDRKIQRHRFGLLDDEIVVGLMPGSRNSEIDHHLKTQLETAVLLVKKNPKIRPVLLVAPTLERDKMQALMGDVGVPIPIIKAEPLSMIDLTDVVLVASGTATLMVGLMEKPMVIMYRMNSVTAWLAKKLVTKTPFFGMANLVAGRKIVPELFQEEANPERLAKEILALCERETRSTVLTDLKQIKERLGSRGATGRVAQVLETYFGSRSTS
ncbi:MAG: lipid-A-disaccharide synthase [Bdellovibrionota bacterium]